MSPLNFEAFRRWAATLEALPSIEQIRKRYGCSRHTAGRYLARLDQQPATADAAPATCMERVFDYLAAQLEPVEVKQVAAALGLGADACMHALQNLHEAERVVRNTARKPFTYTLPRLNLALGEWTRRVALPGGAPSFGAATLGLVCAAPARKSA